MLATLSMMVVSGSKNSPGNSASWTMVAAGNTVGGRNPAPVDRWFIPLLIGFQPSFWWCRISQPSIVGLRWSGWWSYQYHHGATSHGRLHMATSGTVIEGTPFFVLNIQVDITIKIGIEYLSVLTFWTSKWMFWDCSHFFRIIQCFFLVWDSGTQTHYISTLNYSLGTLILKLTISALKTIHKVLRTFHHSSFLRSSTDLSRSRLPICDQSAPASAGGLNGHQWDLSGKNLRWHSNREQNQSGWKGHRYPQLRTASQSSSSWTWENNRPSGCSQ